MVSVNRTVKQCEREITASYARFFREMDIDEKTGFFTSHATKKYPDLQKYQANGKWKFATYPFIGSHYGLHGQKKILVIGLDVGEDEDEGKIMSFDKKRQRVSNWVRINADKLIYRHNPHMRGTLVSILHHRHQLPKKLHSKTYKYALNDELPKYALSQEDEKTPLRDVAITNLYKFVTEDRSDCRQGGENRKFVDEQKEVWLLQDEIKILKPDVIIIQSDEIKKAIWRVISKNFFSVGRQGGGREVHVSPHPTDRRNKNNVGALIMKTRKLHHYKK